MREFVMVLCGGTVKEFANIGILIFLTRWNDLNFKKLSKASEIVLLFLYVFI